MRYRNLLGPTSLLLTLAVTACDDTPNTPPTPATPEVAEVQRPASARQERAEGYTTRGEFRTGYIFGQNGQPKKIGYEIQGTLAIWEGDIILGPASAVAPSPAMLLRGGGIRLPQGPVAGGVYIDGAGHRWPGGVMPYEIDGAVTNQARITNAIQWIEETTAGVTIVPRSGQGDYVRFVNGDGCSSWIGKQGGGQNITLGDGCSTGNAAHEMLHALGMFHEQSRCDRDTYVEIKFDNIEDGRAGNFDKECSGATDFPSDVYDEESIMHYGPFFFSKNGQPTIVSKRGRDHLMGQRSQLSDVDIQTVNHLYGHHNQSPTAVIAPLAASYQEGTPILFNGAGSSDPDDSNLQYSWNFGDGSCSGSTPPAKCSEQNPTHTYADNGSYTVTLTVSDGYLQNSTSATAVVVNVPPVVDAGPDATRLEGDLFLRHGSFSDLGADTWTATVDFGDGGGVLTLPLTGTSFSLGHTYVDNGVYTVTVSVTDDDGGVGTDQVQVTVNNVAPSVDAGSDATLTSGETYNFSGTFSDPGIADNPWTWLIDWDFGPDSTGDTNDQSAPITASRQVCTAGTYVVTLSVTDKDGGTGTDNLNLTVPYFGVPLDIKPGESPNPVNRRSRGRLPLAVLSTATFNASTIDPSTVVLGNEAGDDTPVARKNNGSYFAHVEDVNGDGRPDMVLMFEIPALVANGDLPETATSLVLRGFLNDSCTNIRGSDNVIVVP